MSTKNVIVCDQCDQMIEVKDLANYQVSSDKEGGLRDLHEACLELWMRTHVEKHCLVTLRIQRGKS